eukprot:gnl/Chilomastix_caulleri/5662.p1 GENE.gnl/Chilomastix_caulleri/5662~~gnl/Chilomastix_caulleri/5662.p1  ORF type:complete len:141 (+),score=30.40 gnl/Chilomastix_caulleri/5662:47-469(+)
MSSQGHNKIMKPGRVCVVLQGRYAGKKAVIVQNFGEGTKQMKYSFALVAGVEKPPRRIKRRYGLSKNLTKSRMKTFVKAVNYKHLMPTRYFTPFKNMPNVTSKSIRDITARKAAKRSTKQIFEKAFIGGKDSWLFKRLYF